MPAPLRPELAFIGRSNAGKSTLINALVNQRNIAHTSSTPGKTRTINFFLVENTVYVVDLPGYGFASASKTNKAQWADLMKLYMNRPHPRQVIVSVWDIRRDPVEHDIATYDYACELGCKVIIAATKADKVSRTEQARRLCRLNEVFAPEDEQSIIAVSGEKKTGIPELRQRIDEGLALKRFFGG
jgi:GTP-binding protein